MLSAIFNRAKSCKHGKHHILPYIMYTRTSLLFCGLYICVAGKHIVGPTIKVQHRNMLEKTSLHTYYRPTVSAKDSNVLLLLHVPRWLEGLPNYA